MIIHDLKHPTEAVISQLEFFKAQALSLKSTVLIQAGEIEALKKELRNFKSEFSYKNFDIEKQPPPPMSVHQQRVVDQVSLLNAEIHLKHGARNVVHNASSLPIE